jgi:hypothetical protein
VETSSPRVSSEFRSARNALTDVLQDTNHLGEAEPLMRRALAIFPAFQRHTGHAHPIATRWSATAAVCL